ncbi:outer membrane lipid asymmetry maintenance protein MlaD [Halocynthiibacter namhaensis]|uniref:outer membrane lipid asymmetry maintenance protein MlaD n=1 Tax=Halocynthiibacter namhaensis TaxID=1290553 RepID=UPI000579981E|nr:outer membrane lipid asymmetry maintenance protein MlaD [Halocynthiibacter namhaensis]
MSENKSEILAGGIVLAAAAGFLFYMGQVAGVSAGSGGNYDLTASFRSAEGISVGTDVRLAGVKIGTVTGMSLNAETYRADIDISVLNHVELSEDTSILISSEGLLGGNFVELVPGGSPINLEAGGEIEDTQGSVSLISLLVKFVAGDSGA